MADTIPPDKSASPETAEPRALLPASTATNATPSPAAAAPETSASPSQAPPARKDGSVKSFHLLVLLMVFAITGVGSLMLLGSAMEPVAAEKRERAAAPAAAGEPALAAAPARAPKAAVESPVESPVLAPTPKWMASTNSRKAGYGANVVFELPADHDVEVWRKRTRPVLTMRCAARTTEVFVITNAPATIEGNSNRHTVKVAFDGREPVEQSWEHSIDHDALFAPDGASMMRKITAARTMSFSFEPFNAPPATVTFSVAGFDAHRKAAASKCRS